MRFLRSRDFVRPGPKEGQINKLEVASWLYVFRDGSAGGDREKTMKPSGRLFATRGNKATAVYCELYCRNQVSG
jgi:hypothetical protein